jgi:APA family basic amino acid/polyamine antiporter
VAAAALGANSYADFSKNGAPLVYILTSLGHGMAAQLVAGAAIVALPTVILVLMYGQSRIFFVMARDGLLPEKGAAVHSQRGTPVLMTLITGVVVAVIAGLVPLAKIALLANAGTLVAFMAVALCVLILRVREKDRPRVFKVPLVWIIAPACFLGCLWLFLNGLPTLTQVWFLIWNAIGLVVYLAYSVRKSRLAVAG